MHNGFPCTDMYPNEYFEDGITNGAKWYNVPGKPAFFALQSSRSHLIQTFLSGDIKKSLPFARFACCTFQKICSKKQV